MPRLGRWTTVAFSVAALWIFGFAAEARAESMSATDATSGGLSAEDGTIPDGATSTSTEPVDTSAGAEPADATPVTEPTDPTPTTEPADPTPTTDPVATDPPLLEPAPAPEPIPPVIEPTPPVIEPTPTDPVATDPPLLEPAPAPEPIPPVIEPTPTTETPADIPLPPAAGSGPTDSIVVIDGPLAGPLVSASQGTTLEEFIGISSAVTDRGSKLSPAPEHPGNGHSAPAAPDLPELPAPHNPSAPANPAPGGVGGAGSSALGILAALFALAFAGLLGEVLPVSVAVLRPPDLAFHLKRPG
jgi:hypothetical protein